MGTLAGFIGLALGAFQVAGIPDAPTSIVGAMIIRIVLGIVGGNRWLRILDLLLIATYCIVAATPIIRPLALDWIRTDIDNGSPANAIIVPSSGLTSDSTIHQKGLDRLLTGLELAHVGRGAPIVTTRVAFREMDGAIIDSDTDQRRIIALFGAEDRWEVARLSSSTHDEATGAASLLLRRGKQRVIVVTSPMHTRRACATFETVGFTVTCAAARERDTPVRDPRGPPERIGAFKSYAYERVATITYRRSG